MIKMDPIEAFLDAADLVLNSSSFLGMIPPHSGDLRQDLSDYISSDGLQHALLNADISRGQFNLHYFQEEGPARPLSGRLADTKPGLSYTRAAVPPLNYLEALLQGNGRIGNFISYYRKGK